MVERFYSILYSQEQKYYIRRIRLNHLDFFYIKAYFVFKTYKLSIIALLRSLNYPCVIEILRNPKKPYKQDLKDN